MSAKFKNMSFTTSAASGIILVTKILMIILLGLSVAVFATPFTLEREWSAMVVPVTWSPVTAHLGRLETQSKSSTWWSSAATSTHNSSAKTTTEASYLYSTCRDFSCHENNRLGQNRRETKRCGNNHRHKKKQCGGENQQSKSCDKNQHQKHCGKNQCEKRCGKNQGKKHRGEKRNGQSRHDTTNRNRQNNRQNNIKNGNKRRQFFVDNKVINVNEDRTPSPTSVPRIETTVTAATMQVSITPQSVEHRSCSSFYSFLYLDIIWFSLLAICLMIIFCIYNTYFISGRYHSIIN